MPVRRVSNPSSSSSSSRGRALVSALLAAFVAGSSACDRAPEPPLDGAGTDGAPAADAGSDAGDAGGDGGAGDGSAGDAAMGRLVARIDAGPVAYTREETCVTLAHNGGDGARVTWTWEPEGVPEPGGPRSCHTFRAPGEFAVFVTVEARGMSAETSAAMRVVPRPQSPAPTLSSTIAYDPARHEVWVVNPDADTVTVLATQPTLAVAAEVPVGDRPRTLAVRDGVVAVACQGDGTLHVIDAARRAPARAPVALGRGSRPFGVAADPRGAARFYVTLQDAGRLAVVDAARGAVLADVAVGFDARAVTATATGAVLVTRWRAASDGARVVRVDAADPRAPVVRATALLPRQEELDSDTDNSGVPSFLNAVAFAPDGTRAVVPSLKANIVTGAFNTRERLTSETTARAILTEVFLEPGGGAVESARFSLDDLDYASALVFSPEGSRMFVAVQGAEVVLQLDAFAFNVTGSIDDVGGAPQGLALSPDGARLYVHGYASRGVREYDVRGLSRPPRPLATVVTVAREPLSPEALRGLQVFYRSRDPRMSRTSYLSCASCHQDGEGDNLVFDLTQRGEGLRNTITLEGRGGSAHGPIHWSANFDEVQDFEHDIRGPQGGAGFIPDAQFVVGTRNQPLGDPKAGLSPELDALAAYLATFTRVGTAPARRDDDPAWRASFARGEAIFRSAEARCASCHAGPRFTDSAFLAPGTPRLHDVGTARAGSGGRLGGPLTGLDTPTLRGLWRTPPYLHDGSAATLRDVLTTRNAGDRHGRTSHLDAQGLADLEAFLLAIDDAVP